MENGILGNMIKNLLESKTILIPYYKGEAVPLDPQKYHNLNIGLVESDACRKPWISYGGMIDGTIHVGIHMMFYDPLLKEEANKKGASWLMSEIYPDGINVYNYEEYDRAFEKKLLERGIVEKINTTVYEEEYSLGDRDVLALVIDSSKREKEYPVLEVFFVYDDILVKLSGRPEAVENILPDITFYEINMQTGEQLRDKPGR